MQIFLSGSEASPDKRAALKELISNGTKLHWNLMSFYYLRSDIQYAEQIRDLSERIMIDSGAHSFQKGKKVKWEEYTHSYAQFIKEFDRDNVVGYFEMDVDNIIGYEIVLKLRRILETESGTGCNKIIPVWHKNRGIENFKQMCRDYAGKTVAITGFKNDEIKDSQYAMFLKYAKKHGCKVHCLGMTRRAVLDKVPFDYVDSSSWAQSAIYGRVGGKKVSQEFSRANRNAVFVESYRQAIKMQEYYYHKWKKVCGD